MRGAGNRGGPRGPGAPRVGGPAKPVSIDVPAIPFDELKRITNNFSDRALIGEGSYGRVYNATLSDGRAAVIKKLDTSASQDSDTDFAAQALQLACHLPVFLSFVNVACPHHHPHRRTDRDGLQAEERVFPGAPRVLLGRRQPNANLSVRHNGFFAQHTTRLVGVALRASLPIHATPPLPAVTLFRWRREEGSPGRGARSRPQLGSASQDSLRGSERAGVPAREGPAVHRPPGHPLQQRPHLRRLQLQDRRFQPHQPGHRHRRAVALHSRARDFRIPRPRIRYDRPDQPKERRLQLRRDSSRVADRKEAGRPHNAERPAESCYLGTVISFPSSNRCRRQRKSPDSERHKNYIGHSEVE
ncbi:putative protein kinase [Zea mays]|uniref:Protein kinase domain-containing protein n=1 Tax=Zea mays TaxID=4577 RepID=A0A1D6Q3I8_MAIZE|nr:putative protein kinase [Zea mays]